MLDLFFTSFHFSEKMLQNLSCSVEPEVFACLGSCRKEAAVSLSPDGSSWGFAAAV